MSKMTLEEAVKRFVKDFSNIPASLLIEAYKDHPEDLECLNTSEFLEGIYIECWPAMWGTLFNPSDWTDSEWIRNNIDKLEEIGLLAINVTRQFMERDRLHIPALGDCIPFASHTSKMTTHV